MAQGKCEGEANGGQAQVLGPPTPKVTEEPTTLCLSPSRMPRSGGASQPRELWRRRPQS